MHLALTNIMIFFRADFEILHEKILFFFFFKEAQVKTNANILPLLCFVWYLQHPPHVR